jgi:outer membrane protein assembly factor BamD
MRNALFPLFPLLLLVALLAGCSSDSDDSTEERPPEAAESLYTRARTALAEKDFVEALALFDEVERQHPYSEWSARAQIMAGYTQYERQKYDDALLIFERFVKLHPGNESAAYAYYMIALCHYEQISDVGRDQGMTEQAKQALTDVVRRFPDSSYARDAQLKLDLTEDHLAGKEMMVGRYYQRKGELIPAINRFRLVVEGFQTTSHVPEALHRLVEAYLSLGVRDEAVRYAAVLGHNFADSEWYHYSYRLLNEGRSLPEAADAKDGWLGVF